MSMDRELRQKGSKCLHCGTNYGRVRSFCDVCGSINLKIVHYNSDGVSGSLMQFENTITDRTEFREPWENIKSWFESFEGEYD